MIHTDKYQTQHTVGLKIIMHKLCFPDEKYSFTTCYLVAHAQYCMRVRYNHTGAQILKKRT